MSARPLSPETGRSVLGTSFDKLRTNGGGSATRRTDLGTSFDRLRTNGGGGADPTHPNHPARPELVEGRASNDATAGFSLIEALVALAILAIATVGLVRTVETHIDSTRAMEGRQAAMWVAENRLAELEARIDGANEVEMMGRRWRIAVAERATDDPSIRRARIDVFESGARGATPLASLDGFVDAEGA